MKIYFKWNYVLLMFAIPLFGYDKGDILNDGKSKPNASQQSTLVTHSNDTASNDSNTLGHRFRIIGNFISKKQQTIMMEHYINGHTQKETFKVYKNIANFDDIEQVCSKNPIAFLASSDSSCPPIKITGNCQLYGFAFIKNEGDLDGDGLDELSYVVDWDDASNLNTYIVMGIRNGKWVQKAAFPIHEGILPYYGNDTTTVEANKVPNSNTTKDTLDVLQLVEKKKSHHIKMAADAYSLVKKLKNKRIIATYYDLGEWKQKIIAIK